MRTLNGINFPRCLKGDCEAPPGTGLYSMTSGLFVRPLQLPDRLPAPLEAEPAPQ